MTNTTVQMIFSQPEEADSSLTSTRVALLVEYCGEAFSGSQFQHIQPTVQATLQEALVQLGLSASAVSFASRTDAGVHARGQVAHFDVCAKALKTFHSIPKALNSVLPNSVAIRAAHLHSGQNFHSRRDAAYKWYRYTIYNAPYRSAWATNRIGAAHYNLPLDAERMNQAAQLLLGRHDFRSFKNATRTDTHDICDIRHIQVMRDGDFINFDIAADRFLYKMIRNIAGQLMFIGNIQNPQTPDSILDILAARDRHQAVEPAHPGGLTLMALYYKPPFNFFADDPGVQQLEKMLNPTKMEPLPHENLHRKAS